VRRIKGAGPAHRGSDGKARDLDQLGEQIGPKPLRPKVKLDKSPAVGAHPVADELITALERNLARASEPALRERLAGVIARLREARS
jgi:hypothetical protein